MLYPTVLGASHLMPSPSFHNEIQALKLFPFELNGPTQLTS